MIKEKTVKEQAAKWTSEPKFPTLAWDSPIQMPAPLIKNYFQILLPSSYTNWTIFHVLLTHSIRKKSSAVGKNLFLIVIKYFILFPGKKNNFAIPEIKLMINHFSALNHVVSTLQQQLMFSEYFSIERQPNTFWTTWTQLVALSSECIEVSLWQTDSDAIKKLPNEWAYFFLAYRWTHITYSGWKDSLCYYSCC